MSFQQDAKALQEELVALRKRILATSDQLTYPNKVVRDCRRKLEEALVIVTKVECELFPDSAIAAECRLTDAMFLEAARRA